VKASLKVSYAVMAVVLALALVAGTRSGASTDPVDRAHALAQTIKCPTCRGQAVAQSDAPASAAIREEITRRIDAGQSDDEIRDYFAHQYGDDILLRPAASGFGGLVWVAPVVVLVGGVAGLALVVRRWRRWGAAA
jgi:cytochrome c-type biogenesis protein CcmH/NrfF